MKLTDILMSPVTCQPQASLAEAATTMENRNVGSLIVTDESSRIAGIVTDRDIVVRGVAQRRGHDTPVSEVMTRDVISLTEDADLFDAAARMGSAERRRLPVISADGTLKGVVSLDDLITLFSRQTENLAHVIAVETATH